MHPGGGVQWAVRNPETDGKGPGVGAGRSVESHLCDPL